MKPVQFPGSNVVLGKGQPEYLPLPCLRLDNPEGTVISCWELSDEEIAELARTKRLWVSQLTFGAGFSPQLPQVETPLEVLDTLTMPQEHTTASLPAPDAEGDDEIADLLRIDCRVDINYKSPMHLISDLIVQGLRVLVAKSGIPPVGSVVSVFLSVDKSQAVTTEPGRILLSGLGGKA